MIFSGCEEFKNRVYKSLRKMVKLLTLSYAKITHMQLLVLINTYKDLYWPKELYL